MKMEFDKMDPVFNPQITKLPEGLMENADGLYLLSDVENRFAEAINAYDVSL